MALALTSGPFSISDILGSRAPAGAAGPEPAPAPRTTPVQQAQERLTGIEKQIGQTQQEVGQFSAKQQEFEARQKADAARKKAELVGQERQAIEGSEPYKSLEQSAKEAAEARFQPSQRTAQENIALFGLINVLGFAIGAGGKNNAMQAMSAMNGMVEGVRKGDMDRYTREKDVFNTNLKALHDKTQMLATQVKRITELASRNTQQAMLEFDALQAEQGADFVKQYASKFGLPATLKYLEQTAKGAERALAEANRQDQKEQERIRVEQERYERARDLAILRADLQRAGQMAVQASITARMREQQQARETAAATRASAAANKTQDKPPAKEIVQANTLRNNLIPKIESALPILDRLNKEDKWNKMTLALAVDPRAAEALFQDDPEALNLILTLAYFRSKEFETAGKALTKKEDQILAPIVRGDLRVYPAVRNAMVTGVETLKKEQKGLEAAYPWIGTYNKAFRGEAGAAETNAELTAPKPMPMGEKLKAYADAHFAGDEAKAREYLASQGYR